MSLRRDPRARFPPHHSSKSEKLHSRDGRPAGRDLNSRRRIKNYENPWARRDVYTCRPGSQEFSATRVGRERRGGGSGGGGGQIKLRREIYGRACNEQLFHGMRTPGLASGGGISIRSSSCRPRASRSPSAPIRVALSPEFYSAQKGRLPRLRRRRHCRRRCLRPGMTFLPAMHIS